MAYNPTQMFPGAVDLTDPNFVNGKYKDSSAPGVLDGTPLQAIYFNQRLSMEQAFMDEAGEVYSDSADDPSSSQVATAIKKTYPAINKIKTSQFVVEGTTGDPLPVNGVLTDYAVDAEIALGWVVTTACKEITVDTEGNVYSNNNTGVVEYTFDKADNETPNAASLFASVMRCTDAANSVYVQDHADGSNGISITETTTTITMVIDFSSFAGGKVFGTSEQLGRLPIESSESIGGMYQLSYGNLLHIADQRASGVSGGASIAGANIRALNSELISNIGGASLSSNQITLEKGRYYVEFMTPCHRGGRHQSYFYNTTSASNEIVGSSEYSDSTGQTSSSSFGFGVVSVQTASVFELRQYIESVSSNGLGLATSSTNGELYSQIKIWKVA